MTTTAAFLQCTPYSTRLDNIAVVLSKNHTQFSILPIFQPKSRRLKFSFILCRELFFVNYYFELKAML